RLLEHHAKLHVIVVAGNHDESTAVVFREMLAGHYETEPRVTVDVSPSKFHYFRFGKNLQGYTHGDGIKLERLPLIMATDRPEDWGATRHRSWITGHVHHDQCKDVQGVKVESVRVIPPTGA